MVDKALDGTVEVFTVNAALVWPPTTITVAGTCATVGLLLESCTTTPLAGAAIVSETVPEGCCWPCTDDCDSAIDASARPEGGVGLGEGEGLGPGLGVGSGEVGDSPPQPVTTAPVIRITKIAAPRNAQPRRDERRIRPLPRGCPKLSNSRAAPRLLLGAVTATCRMTASDSCSGFHSCPRARQQRRGGSKHSIKGGIDDACSRSSVRVRLGYCASNVAYARRKIGATSSDRCLAQANVLRGTTVAS